MASTVCTEIALQARVGKCPEGGLGLEWYARGAFVFATAYIAYASEKSTVESFFSHFQIPIRGSGEQIDGFTAQKPADNPFVATPDMRIATRGAGASAEQRAKFVAAAEKEVAAAIISAYQRVRGLLAAQLPGATDDAGAWRPPRVSIRWRSIGLVSRGRWMRSGTFRWHWEWPRRASADESCMQSY